MDTKKTALIIAYMLILAIVASCGRIGEDCAETAYNFKIGVKAYPDKETIRVDDTLWLEVTAPTTFTDKLTNKSVDYSGAENLGSVVGIVERDANDRYLIEAAKNFKLLLVNGRYVGTFNPELAAEYLFTESNSFYTFKLGAIATKEGVFRISFSNAANVFRSKKPCTKARFEFNFVDTDLHLNLFPDFDGDPNAADVYCFRVE